MHFQIFLVQPFPIWVFSKLKKNHFLSINGFQNTLKKFTRIFVTCCLFNRFHNTGFLEVSYRLQGVLKESSGMKWIKKYLATTILMQAFISGTTNDDFRQIFLTCRAKIRRRSKMSWLIPYQPKEQWLIKRSYSTSCKMVLLRIFVISVAYLSL